MILRKGKRKLGEGNGMQKLKFLKKCRKFYIISLLLLVFGIRLDVYACELELEKKTEGEEEKDIEYFDITVSKTWTSRGREILSYDVSENGSILIVFPKQKVGVFDENMKFLFELSFYSSGAYGAVWNGDNILLVDLRSDKAAECDRNGEIVGSYAVIGPNNYDSDIVMKRKREYGEYEYFCTNNKDGNGFYYIILERTSEKYGKEILYKSGNILDGIQYGICILVLFAAVVIGFFLWLAALDSKSTKILDGKPFDGTRTYSTDYSVDDCIGLLSRKNIYDVLRYSFRLEKEDTGELVITGHNKYSRLQMKVCHQVVFGENGNTEIRIKNRSGEKTNPYSYIPQWWMDEFMEQKLDALPMDMDVCEAGEDR